MGDVRDFRNFMGAVIDKRAFDKISEYIAEAQEVRARSSPAAPSTARRATSSRPTLVETKDPAYKLLCEEIFGPVVTVHVYPDERSGARRCRSSIAPPPTR